MKNNKNLKTNVRTGGGQTLFNNGFTPMLST